MVAMSRHVDPPTTTSRWTSSAAWKMCAVAPLAILCTLLLVKAVGSLAGSGAAREAADVPRAAVADVGRTPHVTGADPTAKARKKARADKTSRTPEADPTSAGATPDGTRSSTPTSESSPTRTPSSSHTPTTQPSPSSPSQSPTPEEARDQCERDGVNPVDLTAMSACIADALGDD
jgi:hypothetical protein